MREGGRGETRELQGFTTEQSQRRGKVGWGGGSHRKMEQGEFEEWGDCGSETVHSVALTGNRDEEGDGRKRSDGAALRRPVKVRMACCAWHGTTKQQPCSRGISMQRCGWERIETAEGRVPRRTY